MRSKEGSVLIVHYSFKKLNLTSFVYEARNFLLYCVDSQPFAVSETNDYYSTTLSFQDTLNSMNGRSYN